MNAETEARAVLDLLAKGRKRISYAVTSPEMDASGNAVVTFKTEASTETIRRWFYKAGGLVQDIRWIQTLDGWRVVYRAATLPPAFKWRNEAA